MSPLEAAYEAEREKAAWMNEDLRTRSLTIVGAGFPAQQANTRAHGNIESTVSGTVLQVPVAPGDSMNVDQEVAIVESMKMEVPVVAEIEGTVDEVLVEERDTVQGGDTLIPLKTG